MLSQAMAQLLNLPEEDPFPVHSLFIEFNFDTASSIGLNIQDLVGEVTFWHAFKTYSGTYDGSRNQPTALEFGAVQRSLSGLLQGLSGANFSQLDKKSGPRRMPVHPLYLMYGNTYMITVRDYSATKSYNDVMVQEIDLSPGNPAPPPDLGLFPVQ